MNKKISQLMVLIMLAGLLLTGLTLTGCGAEQPPAAEPSSEAPVTSEAQISIPEVTIAVPSDASVAAPTEAELPEGQMYSYLTGLPVSEEIGKLRPVGFQIDNEKLAMPQCGIAQAEVIYEVPIEANEVRLTAIFQDMTGLDRIGPLRSARSYHPGILAEFDGIFFHNGHSNLALNNLNDSRCDDIEAVDRDYSAKFTRSDHASGHNDFTSPKKTEERIAYRGFRREISDDFTYKFKFAQDEPNTLEWGRSAQKVETGYTQNHSYFVYNADDGLYYRWERGREHKDGDLGEQIAVKNVLILYYDYNLEWDKNTKNIHTVGTGRGAFVTNGKVVDITWEKQSYWDNTWYYYSGGEMDGKEIRLNPGKTWVCMVLPKMTGDAKFE